jgi:endonuclease G, mitochondrial
MKLGEMNLGRFEDAAPIVPTLKEAVIPRSNLSKRLKFLTADGQNATALEQEVVLGTNDLLEANFIDRCLLARTCVGRIRVLRPGGEGWASGFLIAPGIVLTNHHVFPDADSVGVSRIGFDYWYDVAGAPPIVIDEFEFDPDRFFVSDEALDFAAVAVTPQSRNGADIVARKFLRLIPDSGKISVGEYATIFQHPEGFPMQIALRKNEIVRMDPAEPFIWYQADTAHGSSGAPVLNDTFQVVALHSGGRIKRDGQDFVRADGSRVRNVDGLTERDVEWEANAGYRVSRICVELLAQTQAKWPGQTELIENAMRGGDVMSAMIDPSGAASPSPIDDREGAINMPSSSTPIGGSTVNIPLNLQITLSAGTAPTAVAKTSTMSNAPAATDIVNEAFEMRTPIIYDGLDTRPGFDRGFLGGRNEAPMPVVTPAGSTILAPLIGNDADHELKYRHFSVWMHRERRLALFTAANVDWRNRQKIVDGKATSRDALAGWPPNNKFAELWVDDPRLDAKYQLPDIFYTEDRGAFDKGHLTRRDDVCWGGTFEEIQMANGDTFHVTNCSPQTKPFNQSLAGRENWGDLENYVQKITKRDGQAACVYAGPIFAADDRWFRGKVGNSPARIQIPSRYWKIVVVKNGNDFESFGFVLDQDIRAVTETEFAVTAEWMAAWKPIKAIEDQMRGWLDFTSLNGVDQHAGR